MQDISIRELNKSEYSDAMSLVWEVFSLFEAPEYSKEGIDSFYMSIHDPEFLSMLRCFGAFYGDDPVGVIAVRNEGAHIALFFVREEYQRKGIGRDLFQRALADCRCEKMTVNSSPYAVPVYQALGFSATNSEQVVNGLRFTPMERVKAAALKADCPCKRTKCVRHGDCAACRAHHAAANGKPLSACDKAAIKAARKLSRAKHT